MKIAVIGGGLSGASVIKSLINHKKFRKENQIDVFETRERLGVGLPYDADDESIMLNVSPDRLSVDEKNPKDFVEWLERNYEKPANFEGLVARPRYGKYLEEHFEPYFSHPQVTHYQNEIVDIEVLDQVTKEKAIERSKNSYVYRLKTSDGWHETIYDAVFFAIGHPSYADYYNLFGTKNYIHNPYPMKTELADIDEQEKIGIIGSGATGIDLMRYFNTNYNLKHPLTYYVQDELFYFVDIPYEKETFKFTFSNKWIKEMKNQYEGFIPLNLMFTTFKQDIKDNGVNLTDVYHRYEENNLASIREALNNNDQEIALVQAYIVKLIQFLPALFNTLNAQDKDYYLENYHRKLLFFKAHVPNKTFKWLFELLDAGKIRIVWGLTEIIPQADGTFTVIADQKESTDRMINATGFDTNLTNVAEKSELIKNLYEQEFILPHKNGRFILVDWPQTQVINQRYGLLENVFFFGILIGGTQYENNDAVLTIRQATYSAKWYMDHYA